MPKVVYTPGKGLVEQPGTGFFIKGVGVSGVENTVEFKGGLYTITCETDVAGGLNDKGFVFYDRDGASYGIGFNVGAAGGGAPAADNQLTVAFANGRVAASIASDIVSAADGDGTFNAKFEFEAAGAVLSIYVLECGEMSVPGVKSDDTGFATGLALSHDGSGTLSASANSNVTLASASDVANVENEVPLADGSVIGQRITIHQTTQPSNTFIKLTGKFTDGTHSRTTCTFAALDADHWVSLIWNGLRWADLGDDGVTFG